MNGIQAHRRLFALVLAVLFEAAAFADDLSAPGPFPPGWRTVTVTRPDNTSFNARLSYPAQFAGQNAPIAPTATSRPGITFGHGFLQPVSRYASTLDHLSSWGFIVIASESGGELFPSHANFAADLRHCLTYLDQQNSLPASFLFGRVNTAAFGACGHSMGGGASILAAAADSRIRAVATMAAADTSPSSIAAVSSVAVPLNFVCGSADSIVPPASSGIPMYANARPPRLYNLINGGFHCGFEDSSSFGCDTSATMSRATQLAITRRRLTSFFLLHLQGEQTAWPWVWGPNAVADSLVSCTKDPGIAISTTFPALTGRATTRVELPVRVTNTSPTPESVEILVEGPWQAEAALVEQIPPGVSIDVLLSVAMPAAAESATILVAARRADDLASRAFFEIPGRALSPADMNLDEFVDAIDYDAFIRDFLAGLPPADFNADGFMDAIDYDLFIRAFLSGC